MTTALEPLRRPTLTRLQGSFLVLLSGVIFSFGGLAFRSTSDISAWEYITFRGLGAATVAAGALIIRYRSDLPEVIRAVRRLHVLAGFLVGAISCLFIVALDLVTVAFVVFLQTLAPISAAYFSWLIMRERVSKNVVIATVITLGGMAVIVSGTLTDDVSPLGLIALAIPLTFGLYSTLIRSADKIEPTVPVFVSGATMLFVGLAVSLGSGGLSATFSDAFIGFFAGSMLLGFPLVIYNLAQRVVPASETTLLLMSEVVLAPMWVWMFVGEQPESTTLLGGAIILGAILWLTIVRAPTRGRVVTSRG